MSNVVQVRYTIATRGLRSRYNPLVRVYPSASPRVYTLTRGYGRVTHSLLLYILYLLHTSPAHCTFSMTRSVRYQPIYITHRLLHATH